MLGTAFLLGFFGSLHCVAMCGPIAIMLPTNKENSFFISVQSLSYHIGRVVTYAIIGFVIGALAKYITHLFHWQQHLSVLAGLFIILMGVFPNIKSSNSKFSKHIFRLTSIAKIKLGLTLKKKGFLSFLAIGFFNGWLPCGLVYVAALGALASPSALEGAIYMTSFGLGTIPLLGVAQYFGFLVKSSTLQKLRRYLPVLLIIIGILFVLRGLGLHIPYLSPGVPAGLMTGSDPIFCL